MRAAELLVFLRLVELAGELDVLADPKIIGDLLQ